MSSEGESTDPEQRTEFPEGSGITWKMIKGGGLKPHRLFC